MASPMVKPPEGVVRFVTMPSAVTCPPLSVISCPRRQRNVGVSSASHSPGGGALAWSVMTIQERFRCWATAARAEIGSVPLEYGEGMWVSPRGGGGAAYGGAGGAR